jgi:tricorn protease
MVTGWSNDGMKVVFTLVAKCTLSRFRSLWEISTEGAIQVLLIYLELQTANSPQTDCSLYMNISPWEHEFRNYRGGQNNPLRIFDLKPLRHRNYLGKTAEISILDGQHDLLSF